MDKFEKFLNGCNYMTVKPGYLVGLNEPGHMPDESPWSFDTFEEAKEFVIWSIKREEEQAACENMAKKLCNLAENVNLEKDEFTLEFNGYVYWVKKDESLNHEFSYEGCDCCNDGLGNNV